MKGLELSKRYFEEYGKSMLQREFSDIMDKLAVGLTGGGSECYGFDDKTSTDHDFEPAFCIFIPDESIIDRKTAFSLERAYSKLPKEFLGFKQNTLSPVGGNRHGVIRISDFFEAKTGKKDGKLSEAEWFSVPEYALFEATNGEIFFDYLGLITSIRNDISYYPEDVRLKKLAGNLLLMAQSGQYNYARCLKHGEKAAAQMAIFDFVKSGMQTVFLLNKKYMPYYKWSFRALSGLKKLSNLYDSFEYLITTDNQNEELKKQIIEDICSIVSGELKNQDIINESDTELERLAYKVNDRIDDNALRNLNIFYGI